MADLPQGGTAAKRSYLTGLTLALVLTAIPFGLVAWHLLSPTATFAVIAAAAIVQVVVHLRFFLHLGLRPGLYDRLAVMALAAILIFLMVGGSLWIMFDLYARMGMG